MSDKKISQLSAATALSGTEVVPVVQGGLTKKATIDQILAPASGKGINFAAAGGDILNMYDEGTWTPTIEGTGTAGTATYAARNGRYTRIGRQVFVEAYISWSGGTGAGSLIVNGLPFQSANSSTFPAFTVIPASLATPAGEYIAAYLQNNTTYINIVSIPNSGNRNALAYDAAGEIMISGCYSV